MANILPTHASSDIQLLSAVPVFLVSDVNDTARWYGEKLGFQTMGIFPEQPPASWASIQRDGAELMLQRLAGHQNIDLYSRRPGGVWNAYLRMRGIHALYQSVRNQPFIKMPLKLQPYGSFEFEVVDPNGYILATFLGRPTP
jgi:hypothetical protein